MQKSEYTEEKWREICKSGGKGTVMSPSWLLNGCPKCGCKTWMITNDGWAYCNDCCKGYSTDYPFTSAVLTELK